MYLGFEAVGTTVWWLMLWLKPETRQAFLAPMSPDSTLLAFALPDGIFYIGAALISAYGVAQRRKWAWPVLCIHTGAVVYAGLYGVSLLYITGKGWLGALLMLPSLVVLPFLTWRLRPNQFP